MIKNPFAALGLLYHLGFFGDKEAWTKGKILLAPGIRARASFWNRAKESLCCAWASLSLRFLGDKEAWTKGKILVAPDIRVRESFVNRAKESLRCAWSSLSLGFFNRHKSMAVNYWDKFNYECCYHLYNRSSDHGSIFLEDEDYLFFLSKVKLLLAPYCAIYAYCLMPNHFHFIIQMNIKELIASQANKETSSKANKYLSETASLNDLLGDQLRRLFSSYGLRFNHKYNRKGPVFAPRSKRVFISNDDRLRYLIAYVHHNPIHHGFSNEFEFWKFSSFNVFKSKVDTKIARDKVLDLYGSQDSFLSFHNQFKLENSIDEIE